MSIEPIGAAAAPAQSQSLLGAQGADFNMFLKMLTTQMQNQDPLNPMDSTQYTEQLAQYSQVEQSIQQTGLLKDLLARMSASDMTQAAGLIGREAEFASSISGLGSRPASWNWSVPHEASAISGEVLDSDGRAVATVILDPKAASGRYSWDGRLASGAQAPAGAYVLKLAASDTAGNSLPVTIHSVGQVREVVQNGGQLWLSVGGASLPMSDLIRVSAAELG